MRHEIGSVMIFAAGLGTRMQPLSLDRPKAMVEVASRPLIDHALEQARAIRPERIVVNTHAHAQLLEDHLKGADGLALSYEETLLETGGGLRKAQPLLGDGPVFALNSDAVWSDTAALATLGSHWDAATMDALLLLVPVTRAHGHAGSGSFAMNEIGQLSLSGDLVYTGAQIVDPALLRDCPDEAFSIWWLWNRALAKGRLFGCLYGGHWADVGTPFGIAAAETMLKTAHV